MTNSLFSDDEFLAAFESSTLDDFHHCDHVRAAWIYLLRFPFPEATRRMAESLRRFATQHGAYDKYHETITQAWMRLVWYALNRDSKDGTVDFEAFAAAHPELLDTHSLGRFYSSRLLTTSAARSQFVPPDLSPLPCPTHNP